MNGHFRKIGLGWILAVLFVTTVFGQDAEFVRFQKLYQRLKSISANFTQHAEMGRGNLQADGKLWVLRPGRMRWDYHQPHPKSWYFNHRSSVCYDPVSHSSTVSALRDDDISASPLLLLLYGKGDIFRPYRIVRIPSPHHSVSNYRLTAKSPKKTPFPTVEMTLDIQTGFISEISLIDQQGQRQSLSFSSVQLDVAIPPGVFIAPSSTVTSK